MSKAIYNGVVIEDVLLNYVDQQVIYDTDGGVDPIHVRTVISFTGTVHVSSNPTILGVNAGGGLEQTREIQRLLTTPRRRFQYFLSSSSPWWDVSPDAVGPNEPPAPGAAEFDLNNGPRPQCRVDQVRGDRSMRITFTVEMGTWPCSNPKPAVHIRYYCTDDIDENWYTTRTFRGRVRVRSKAIQPHAMRGLVVPPLQGGFRPIRMQFAESANGLELSFDIVHRQEFAAPPFPATTWSGRSDVTTNDGSTIIEAVQVSLEGPTTVSKKDLLALALKIIDVKLQVIPKISNTTLPIIIEYASFSEELHRNAVNAVMRIKHTKETPSQRLFFITNTSFGEPLPPETSLDENYQQFTFQQLQQTATLAGLFSSAMQTPCDPSILDQSVTVITEEEGEAPDEGEEPDDSPDDTSPDYEFETSIEPEQQQYIYTDYRLSSTYDQKQGRVGLPLSDTDGIALVNLHRGITHRYIRVSAERAGAAPTLPMPIDFVDPITGITHHLIDWKIEAVAPKLSPDGFRYVFGVEMNICYALSRIINPMEEGITSGTLPYDTANLTTTFLPQQMFRPPMQPNSLV